MSAISDAVRQTAAQVFGVPDEAITTQSSPDTVEQWDSTYQLYLILALEERFGIELAPEDMEKFSTIGEIADALERKIGSGTATG